MHPRTSSVSGQSRGKGTRGHQKNPNKTNAQRTKPGNSFTQILLNKQAPAWVFTGAVIGAAWALGGRMHGLLPLLTLAVWVSFLSALATSATVRSRVKTLWPWGVLAAVQIVFVGASALQTFWVLGTLAAAWALYTARAWHGRAHWHAGAAVLSGGVLSVLGLAFHMGGATARLGMFTTPNPTFFSTFSYYNHWGAFAMCSAALGIGLAIKTRSKSKHAPHTRAGARLPQWVWWGPTAAVLISIPASGGRASFLALCLGLFIGMLYVIYFIYLAYALKGGVFKGNVEANQGNERSARSGTVKGKRSQRRASIIIATLATFAVLAAALVWVLSGAGPLQGYINKTMFDYQLWQRTHQLPLRIAGWRDTLVLFAHAPLFGCGWGNYAAAIAPYMGPEFAVVYQGQRTVLPTAHSSALQLLAEAGAVGAVLLALPFKRGLARMAGGGCGALATFQPFALFHKYNENKKFEKFESIENHPAPRITTHTPPPATPALTSTPASHLKLHAGTQATSPQAALCVVWVLAMQPLLWLDLCLENPAVFLVVTFTALQFAVQLKPRTPLHKG